MADPAWSHSARDSFETCPKKHYHTRVLKDVKEEEGEAQRWGKKVHKAFEERVAKHRPLPPELAVFEPAIARLTQTKGEVFTEQQIAITKEFQRTEWFAKDVWLRVVVDLLIKGPRAALIVDYKTGKPSDDYSQLELTAAVIMTLHPELESATLAYIWTQTKQITSDTVVRPMVAKIWQNNIAKLKGFNAAYAENNWPAKPNGLCKRYCPVRQCPHNGK